MIKIECDEKFTEEMVALIAECCSNIIPNDGTLCILTSRSSDEVTKFNALYNGNIRFSPEFNSKNTHYIEIYSQEEYDDLMIRAIHNSLKNRI